MLSVVRRVIGWLVVIYGLIIVVWATNVIVMYLKPLGVLQADIVNTNFTGHRVAPIGNLDYQGIVDPEIIFCCSVSSVRFAIHAYSYFDQGSAKIEVEQVDADGNVLRSLGFLRDDSGTNLIPNDSFYEGILNVMPVGIGRAYIRFKANNEANYVYSPTSTLYVSYLPLPYMSTTLSDSWHAFYVGMFLSLIMIYFTFRLCGVSFASVKIKRFSIVACAIVAVQFVLIAITPFTPFSILPLITLLSIPTVFLFTLLIPFF